MPYLSVLAAAALVGLFPRRGGAPDGRRCRAGPLLALRLPGSDRPGTREWDLGYLAAVRTYADHGTTSRARPCGAARILTSWPLTECLRRPELGYVAAPLQAFRRTRSSVRPTPPRLSTSSSPVPRATTPPALLHAYRQRAGPQSRSNSIAVDRFRCDVYRAPVTFPSRRGRPWAARVRERTDARARARQGAPLRRPGWPARRTAMIARYARDHGDVQRPVDLVTDERALGEVHHEQEGQIRGRPQRQRRAPAQRVEQRARPYSAAGTTNRSSPTTPSSAARSRKPLCACRPGFDSPGRWCVRARTPRSRSRAPGARRWPQRPCARSATRPLSETSRPTAARNHRGRRTSAMASADAHRPGADQQPAARRGDMRCAGHNSAGDGEARRAGRSARSPSAIRARARAPGTTGERRPARGRRCRRRAGCTPAHRAPPPARRDCDRGTDRPNCRRARRAGRAARAAAAAVSRLPASTATSASATRRSSCSALKRSASTMPKAVVPARPTDHVRLTPARPTTASTAPHRRPASRAARDRADRRASPATWRRVSAHCRERSAPAAGV